MACDTIKIETLDADEVVSIVTQGPQGPSGAEAATLTTTGDLLYRAALANDRLPIGSEGQVLKVASGLPAWGNESGAVTSVNGETGAVVLDAADVGAAPATGIDPTAIAGTAVVDSDPRLSDARTPSSTLAHSSSHHTGGTDAIAPNEISAAWALETRQHGFFSTSAYTLAQGRNVQLNVSIPASGATGTITLPRLTTDSAQNGDDVFVVLSGTMDGGQTLVIERYIWTGASYDASKETIVTTTTAGAWKFRLIGAVWTLLPVQTHTHGNITNTGQVGTTANLPLKTGTGGIVEAGAFGTGAGEFAEGNHTHTQLHDKSHSMTDATSHTAGNHKVFYSDGSGNVQELALGNSGEVLTSNGATSAPSFAAASGGVTAVGASTADVLSVSGSDLVADDGGTIDSSDPFIKWDDTAGKLVYANPLSRPSGAFYVGLAPTTTALGSNAINFQATRTNAADVASGSASICIGTGGNRASGQESISIGTGNLVSGLRATGIGLANTASGQESVALGSLSFASGVKSVGVNETAVLRGQVSLLPFRAVYWGGQTTDATPLILNLDATATNRFTIAANTALAVDILLVARRSDTADKWLVARRFLGIRRDGSNNTSLIGSVQTLGTDQSEGSPSWSFTLTADDTNEALQLEVTGAASETVQWRATAFYRVV